MAITDNDLKAITAALGPGGTNSLSPAQRGVTPSQTANNSAYSALSPVTKTPQGTTAAPTGAPTAAATTSLSPAVITSKPAGQDLGKITADYQNIKTGVANQSTLNKATTAANNAVPSMPGYNVSANPNSGEGVISMKNNANGQTYYATPLTPPTPKVPTASDMVNTQAQQTQSVNPYDTSLTQATTEETNANNAYGSSTNQVSSEQQNAYNDFKSKVDQLTQGTFPLTGAQQALIDSTKASFDQAAEQANLRGAALSSETGGFSNKVSATLGEINSIDAQKAGVLANLENGFQTQDYNLIKDAYNAFTDLETKKTATIEKLHNDAIDHVNSIRSSVAAQQKAEYQQAQDQIKNDLESDKFTWQQKNDMAQNAIQAGQLDLDTWYKQQDVALKAADNEIKNKEYNALYGGLVDSTTGAKSTYDVTQIPGVSQTNSGVTYFDPSSITDPKLKVAAEARARQLGIEVVKPTEADALTKLDQALQQIDLLEGQANKIAPSNVIGAKPLAKVGNILAGGLENTTGYATQGYLDRHSYDNGKLGLLTILGSVSGTGRISPQLLSEVKDAIPEYSLKNMDSKAETTDAFNNLRAIINRNIKSVVPSAPLSDSGVKQFKTTSETIQNRPETTLSDGSSIETYKLAAELAQKVNPDTGEPYTDEDINVILNQ